MERNELQSRLTELESKVKGLENRIEELEEFKRKNELKLSIL